MNSRPAIAAARNALKVVLTLAHGIKLASIGRIKVVHLFHNDKFTAPFVGLINSSFDAEEHVFIVDGGGSADLFKIPKGPNVIVTTHLSTTFETLVRFCCARARQVILHGLFNDRIARVVDSKTSVAKKSWWLIWGGDLYSDIERNPTGSARNRRIFRSIRGALVVAPGDFDIAARAYGARPPHFVVHYVNPVSMKDLQPRARGISEPPVIQINNSCDTSTLEVIEWLRALDQPGMRIRVIHSYGEMDASDLIERRGTEAFGDRFEVIREYMSPAAYGKFLSENDILIMNQRRQQGLGNIAAALQVGTKLYVRRDVTTWAYLADQLGMKLFDTCQLCRETSSSLTEFNESDRALNRLRASNTGSTNSLIEKWKTVFEFDSETRAPLESASAKRV